MGYLKDTKFLKLFKTLSSNVNIPKVIIDKFRTQTEYTERLTNLSKFDNLEVFFEILKNRLLDIKNILSDINTSIDRNNLDIKKLEETKNNKINFSTYSEGYSNPDETTTNPILKNTIGVNTSEVIGIIADEDSGLIFNEVIEEDKSFIKLNLDDSKINGIKFISDASVQISWNKNYNAYEIIQNDIFQYNSIEPETEITITHNLSTRGLDIKTFKLDQDDIELRYPITTGIEYPNDDQVKIYLTSPQLISVLIARI